MRLSRCSCIAKTPSISSPKRSRFFSLFVAIWLSPRSLNAPSLTGLPFRIDRRTQDRLLRRRQIVSLVLPVQREQPHLVFLGKKVVNDAQTAAFPLAARLIAPAQFAESTGTRHDPPGFRVVNRKELKRQQSCVIEIRTEMARKGRRLEKLHRLNHTLNAYGLAMPSRRRSKGSANTLVASSKAGPPRAGAEHKSLPGHPNHPKEIHGQEPDRAHEFRPYKRYL